MLANPHSLGRGRDHRVVRDPRQPRVHLHPRRGPARHPPRARRRPRGLRGRLPRHATSRAPASTSTSSSTPAPARTSAAKRLRCSTRSRVSAVSRGSSHRSPRLPASTRRRRSSTTSRRSPAFRRSSTTAPTGTRRMAARSRRASSCSLSPATSSDPGSTRRRMGTTMRELLEWAGGMREGHRLKFWVPGGSSVPLLTEEHLDVPYHVRGHGRGRLDAGHRHPDGLRRDHQRRPRGHSLAGVLQARVVRQVHALPRGHLLAGRPAPAPRERRRAATPTSTRINEVSAQITGPVVLRTRRCGATPFPGAIKYFADEIALGTHTAAADLYDPVAATVFAGVNADDRDHASTTGGAPEAASTTW